MVITSRFVFVHMPKTGGNFIAKLCREHLPADWVVDHGLSNHTPASAIPAPYQDLPALCFVRNPWDWYVSFYHYMTKAKPGKVPRRQKRRIYLTTFDGGGNDFATTIENLCEGRTGHLPVPDGVDFYSARFATITRAREGSSVEVERFEELRPAFEAFLARHGIQVPDGFRAALRTAPPTNTTERSAYRDYYDDRLRDLVAERCRGLIDRYGYAF